MTAVSMVAFATGCIDAPEDERPWQTDLPHNPEDGSHLDLTSDLFYEGWYHNVVIPELGEAFFFLYGISNPNPDTTHPAAAFLYCGRQSTLEAVLETFPVGDYSAAEKHRDVRIGNHARATALRIAGEAVEGDSSCSWDIDLDDSVSWHETMGRLTGTDGLETAWTVGTIRAKATGWVRVDGETIRFEDAVAYGDHNWGKTFPREWIWVHSGSFEGSTVALSAAGGTVPWENLELNAMMIGLLVDDEIVSFRTQDLDTVEFDASPGTWSIRTERRFDRILIEGHCELEDMFHLVAPTPDGLQERAYETLAGTMELTYERRAEEAYPWETVFQGTTDWASLEIGD